MIKDQGNSQYKTSKRSGLILACFLLLVIFGSLASLGLKWFLLKTYEPEIVFSADPADKSFYETVSQFPKKVMIFDEPVQAMIVPHHLLAADLIAEAFSNLNPDDYESVILLSPNHFNIGEGKILSSAYPWDTPYGRLETDKKVFRDLAKQGIVSPNEDVFAREHGVRGEVAFIKKFLPDVKVLPLVLKPTLSNEEALKLGEFLFKLSREKRILVLLSADFSHYKTNLEAQAEDKKTLNVLNTLALDKISEASIDTPPGLLALMEYARLSGTSFQLLKNSNSELLSGQKDIKETTSYITGYFSVGQTQGSLPVVAPSDSLKFLFVGDLMLDRYVAEAMGTTGLPYLFSDLAKSGFFEGQDIISANLEGAVTDGGKHLPPNNPYDFAFAPEMIKGLKAYGFNFFNTANNHLSDQGAIGIIETYKNLSNLGFLYSGCKDREIAECSATTTVIKGQQLGFLGFSMVYGKVDEDKLLAEVSRLANSTDLLIVSPHWGVEYQHNPASNQIALAYKMIDAGADLIVGHHPHVVQGVEQYNGKLIFYSLGNFVFDQSFSIDTQEELAVKVEVKNGDFDVSLLPIRSTKNQLRLMVGTEKEKFLKKISGWSKGSELFLSEINSGKFFIDSNKN